MKTGRLSLIAACALFCGANAFAETDHSNHDSAPSHKMHESMNKMMEDMNSMKMKDDTDKDFAPMMKRHHQAGIEMAKEQVAHGKDPEMKKMAKKMIDDQTKESQKLETWLSKRK